MEPRYFSKIKQNHHHLLELEIVLFSVFYPSGFGSGQGELSRMGEEVESADVATASSN
jgi:hypothetical protein